MFVARTSGHSTDDPQTRLVLVCGLAADHCSRDRLRYWCNTMTGMVLPWRERCQRFEDGHITTDRDIQMVMGEEITELRADNARLRKVIKHFADMGFDKARIALERKP